MIKILCTALTVSALLAQTAESKKPEKPALTTYKDTISYILGLDIGSSLSDFKDEIEINTIIMGLKDKLDGKDVKFSPAQAKPIMQQFSRQMSEKKDALLKKQGEKNLVEGKKILATNKKKPGVITTASGLQYMVISEGEGLKPKPGNSVRVDYIGTLIDGTEFDNSIKAGQPAEFMVHDAIKGWSEVLQLMKPGSKYKVFIPPELGYREKETPPKIEPNEVLIFEIELLEIVE